MALNPFPGEVPDKVLDLLFRWFEWRQRLEAPKSLRMPEVTYRWRIQGGYLLAEPGFCLTPSTAPRDPGRLWEFDMAMLELAWEQRRCVEALVWFQSEPWLRGEKWTHFFGLLNLRPRRYERLLLNALLRLTKSARRRRLL